MNYRPDIDGLRAIAIILVLAYHGELPFFPSGFIGVDIFFVISGFLITSIIHNTLSNSTFSFLDFYNRRLWRLQPVFICLLLLTTALTVFFFLPDDLMQYSKSARKTSLFLANFFFDKTTTGYFSPATQQLPLLHTWSLAIEWQCYLLLPLIIYCLYQTVPQKYFIAFIYGLTFITFLYSLHNAQNVPAHTYYLFSSRIFEFLIGSCVALTPPVIFSINKYILTLVSGLALITLLYIAHFHSGVSGYPNWYTFVVCIATGLLIVVGTVSPQHALVQLLEFKPLVFIGLLSYSLYIWHWVIFSLLKYQNIVETPFVLVVVYGFIFLLAYLSWEFIEKPSRRWKKVQFRYTFALLVLVPILITHLTSYAIKINNGFPQRFNRELVDVYQQLERYNSKQRPFCVTHAPNKIGDNQCLVGSKNTNSKKALMIGDSFSNHYWGFVDILGQTANVSILMQGISSCITLPNIALYDWWHFKKQIYQYCHDQTEKYFQMIQSNHYDYVIIGQLWSNYLSDSVINKLGDNRSLALTQKRLEQALDKALTIIIKSGAQPLLIKSTALMQKNFSDCFYKHIKFKKPYNPNECNFKLTLSTADLWFNQLFDKMKKKYPQLLLIDPKKVQCIKNRCKAAINGVPVYRDIGHITDYASYQLGMLYLQRLPNPLS